MIETLTLYLLADIKIYINIWLSIDKVALTKQINTVDMEDIFLCVVFLHIFKIIKLLYVQLDTLLLTPC